LYCSDAEVTDELLQYISDCNSAQDLVFYIEEEHAFSSAGKKNKQSLVKQAAKIIINICRVFVFQAKNAGPIFSSKKFAAKVERAFVKINFSENTLKLFMIHCGFVINEIGEYGNIII